MRCCKQRAKYNDSGDQQNFLSNKLFKKMKMVMDIKYIKIYIYIKIEDTFLVGIK